MTERLSTQPRSIKEAMKRETNQYTKPILPYPLMFRHNKSLYILFGPLLYLEFHALYLLYLISVVLEFHPSIHPSIQSIKPNSNRDSFSLYIQASPHTQLPLSYLYTCSPHSRPNPNTLAITHHILMISGNL